MLDINLIRQNPDKVKKGISAKNTNPKLVDDFLALDNEWRKLVKEIDDLRASQKKLGEERKIDEASKIKSEIQRSEEILKRLEINRQNILEQLPNLPLDDVPVGKDESENVSIREWGKIPKFDFTPKEHWQLGEELDVIDMARGAKVSGARFGYLKGKLALLEFALIQYAFSVLTDEKVLAKIIKNANLKIEPKSFIPVVPPVMIKPDVFSKMARLEPKEEKYYISSDDLYLIGSAEHTLGSMHMDEVFSEDDLPLRYVGFSTSFRREAGSYGKDMKGILRVHQFDKIEMESFSLPEKSVEEQNFFVAIQEYLMQSLEIPYRVVAICTGDMGAPDARQIDIEAWLPGQNKYRETHTSDLMTDYQARRLNTKFKRDNKNEFVHMNDATAFAISRTPIAIMENYQQKDGSILMPKVLQKYLSFKKIDSQSS